jgi:multimeric flavodoxin WrbA
LTSPIYWFTYSAQLKLLIDRFYALYHPSEGFRLKNKPFLVMLVYADEDVYTSGAINAIRSFEDAFRFCKIEHYEFIYGSGPNMGDIAKNEGLMLKIFEKGKNLLR